MKHYTFVRKYTKPLFVKLYKVVAKLLSALVERPFEATPSERLYKLYRPFRLHPALPLYKEFRFTLKYISVISKPRFILYSS
jgi:hypothetical protein